MDVSKLIKGYLKDQGITITHLAKLLGESKQNLTNKLNRNASLDSDFIKRVSKELQHDFFYDLSKMFRAENKEVKISIVEESRGLYEKNSVSKSDYDSIVKENLDLHRELLDLYKEYRQSEKRTSTLKK